MIALCSRRGLSLFFLLGCVLFLADHFSACQHLRRECLSGRSQLHLVRASQPLRGGSDGKESNVGFDVRVATEEWANLREASGSRARVLNIGTEEMRDVEVSERAERISAPPDEEARRSPSVPKKSEAQHLFENEVREQQEEDQYLAAIQLHPASLELVSSYAEWLRERGKTQHASQQYEKALCLAPSHSTLLNNFASFQQHALADYPKASLYFRKALEACQQPSEKKRILVNLAQSLIVSQQNESEVESLFIDALRLDPVDPDNLVNFATYKQHVHDYEGAEMMFRQAVAIDYGHLQGLNGLAVLLETVKGDPTGAETYYKRAYEVDSTHVPTLANLAHNLHAFKRDFDTAESLYKRCLFLSPQHASVLTNFGHLLQNERGNIAAAESLYKQAISVDPGHQPALLNYAGLLAKWDQGYHLSLALYQQALRVDPSHLVARFNYASLLHHSLQRLEEAEKVYVETLALQPSFVPVRVNYGLLLEQTERFEEANDMYRSALELEPSMGLPSPAETMSYLYLRGSPS